MQNRNRERQHFATWIRSAVASMTRRLPAIKGEGRLVLAIDSLVTSQADPESYLVVADVNNASCRMLLDLRGWEQKFAFYYSRWEYELVSAVARHLRHGAFYDIGASIGLYSTTFGRVMKAQNSYVRAFEPVFANVSRLRGQLPLNGLDENTVRIEATALGDREGSVRIQLLDSGRPGNAKITGENGDGVNVPIVKLDHIWRLNNQEAVGFVKIDTEGWDAKIIDGARELLQLWRPNLLVEFNRERMRNLRIPIEPPWKFLTEELGYECYRIDRRGREIRIRAPGDWENLLFIQPTAAKTDQSRLS